MKMGFPGWLEKLLYGLYINTNACFGRLNCQLLLSEELSKGVARWTLDALGNVIRWFLVTSYANAMIITLYRIPLQTHLILHNLKPPLGLVAW